MPKPALNNTDRVWDADTFQVWLDARYGREPIVVLANRQPVRHDYAPDGTIVTKHSSGGLIAALEPLMRASTGVWVAHGSGTADRVVVDGRDGVDVGTGDASYRLRRVWLEPRVEQGYYYGFANEGLWPLCHRAHVPPIFRADDYEMYRLANRRFAAAVLDEAATDSPVVLVQDYQVALAPEMIRQRLPQSTIIAFWHIPFPQPGDFAVCPWGRSLLEGMLGSSIVGFQTPDDCRNFFDTIEHQLGAVVNRARNTVRHGGRDISIRAYPASIEWPGRWAREAACIDTCRADVRARLQLATDTRLVLGVDRLDYTKGIAEKFAAVERLLETHPEYLGRLVFVQVAEPSRECLPAYRELRLRLANRVEQINSRFGTGAYRPIMLLDTRHEPADVHRLMRAADICYVGSLHDGMNLVAKEFVGARDDNRGVLILSQFAGAARELRAALIVNPYATDDCARSLAIALAMPAEEQSQRMLAMRAVIARFNTYRWAGDMLADALDIRRRTLYANDAMRRRWPQPAIRV